jgi:hypothetical protein
MTALGQTEKNSVRANVLRSTCEGGLAGSDGGANRWATVCSLITTAKLNDVEPFAYLTAGTYVQQVPRQPPRRSAALELAPIGSPQLTPHAKNGRLPKSANPFFATFLLRPRAPSLFAGSFAGTSNEMFGRFQACKSAR